MEIKTKKPESTVVIQIQERKDVGTRIDKFITEKFSMSHSLCSCSYSRGYFQRLIDTGNVVVNSDRVKRSYKLKFNDIVKITFIDETSTSIVEGVDIPLKIVYEDEQILVIDKPANLIVHPAGRNKTYTLLNGLVYYFRKHNIPGEPKLVHRLDRDTTGVLVVAKTEEAKNFISRQFQKRNVKKTYLALVYGNFNEKLGIINAFIGRSVKTATGKVKMCHTPLGKESITKYRVLQEFLHNGKYYSLLEIKPITGRTHQIRVHLSMIGHSVCGDPDYCKSGNNDTEKNIFPRTMLHSQKLKLIHPKKKVWTEFVAVLPQDFSRILSVLSH